MKRILFTTMFLVSSLFSDQVFVDREGREVRIVPASALNEIDLVQGKDVLTEGLSISERNRVFEVDGVRYVLHSLETDAELYMMQEVGRLGIGPRVIASFPEKKLAVMEFVEEPTITPEIACGHCKAIGAALRQVHGVPLFGDRGQGIEKENQVRWEYIQAQGARVDTELSRSLLECAAKATRIFEEGMGALSESGSGLVANIHTDPHPRNLFWTDRGLLIIDWESSSHGHPYFDIASLAIFLAFDQTQEEELLEGYFERSPTRGELCEYLLLKKIRWAYTSVVNAMWAYRVLEKEPAEGDIAPPEKPWSYYMQSFGSTKGRPSLGFFVDVARLALREACKSL